MYNNVRRTRLLQQCAKFRQEVVLHVKDAPVFVSDVTEIDIPGIIEWLEDRSSGVQGGIFTERGTKHAHKWVCLLCRAAVLDTYVAFCCCLHLLVLFVELMAMLG